LRTAAGVPGRLRTMYRHDGSRHTVPYDVDRLPGWEGSRPVHVGNPAADQFQLDIYGEVLDSLHLCEKAGLGDRPWDIAVETELVSHLEKVWEKPDQGIWESRTPARHYTHSKVMAWVGVDRYLKLKDIAPPRRHELEGLRERMHVTICRNGFDSARNTFVQTFDEPRILDASLLMLPLVGFLPIDDPRIAGTIDTVEAELRRSAERGYHQSLADYSPDLAGVALPLPLGERRLSVVVAGPMFRMVDRLGHVAEIIRRAVQRHVGQPRADNSAGRFSHAEERI